MIRSIEHPQDPVSSRSSRAARATVACVIAFSAVVFPAHAADDKKSDREARRALLLEQRLEQERSQWQTERADFQKKVADLDGALTALRGASDITNAQLAKTTQERASLQRKLEELIKTLADQQLALEHERAQDKSDRDRFASARALERAALNSRIDLDAKSLAMCAERNERLVKLGHDLLLRVRDKGLIDVVRQEEPFLGIGDVEMFNVVQGYRDKIGAEQFTQVTGTR